MNLGETIYHLRTQRNLSQGDLANALEVSRQSVSKWENNSAVPELEKLIKMSRLFGVTLDELVGSEPTPEIKNSPTSSANNEPSRPVMVPRRITGIVLLGFGLLTFLVFATLSFIPGLGVEFEFSLLFSVPLILCGIICLCCKQHAGYLCALAIYLTGWTVLAIFVPYTYGAMAWIVRSSFLGFGICLLAYTAICFKGIEFHTATKIALTAILLLSIIVNIGSLLPPREVETVPGNITYEGDASVSPD